MYWEASAEDRSTVFMVGGAPLLRMRRKGRRWIFGIVIDEAFLTAEEAADAVERWLFDMLGPRSNWLDPARLETLQTYVDFLTMRDDEPTSLERVVAALDRRLDEAAERGTYKPPSRSPQ